jgi:hypothetical protein
VLGNIEVGCDLADGSERIRRLVQMPAPCQLTGSRKTLALVLAAAIGGRVG